MNDTDEFHWDPNAVSHSVDEISQVEVDDVLCWLNCCSGKVAVTYRLSLSAQNPIDFSFSYLEAIFLGEKLAPSCVSHEVISTYDHLSRTLGFRMVVSKRDDWAREAHWICRGLALEDPEGIEVADCVEETSDAVYSSKTLFPELGDSCLANLVNGYFSDYPSWHEELLERFPEWRYRYWKSCWSGTLGFDVFVSASGWIVPPDADFPRVLGIVGEEIVAESALEELRPVPTGEKRWIFCASDAIHRADPLIDPDTRAFIRSRFGKAPSLSHATWTKVRGGEAVMARFRDFGLVTFWDGQTRLRPQAIADLRNSLVGHLDAINLASAPTGIPEVDWSKCSPQVFETICRELLCRSGKFDPDTVRSFGKVNSRDGGRDIEIGTRARPGVSPAKWIFQCKRYLNGRSITKSDINVSDMIDEYGIEGFGIMTSGDGYSEILEAVRTQIRAQISKVFPTAQIAANSIWACIRGSRSKEKQKSGLVPLPSMLT